MYAALRLGGLRQFNVSSVGLVADSRVKSEAAVCTVTRDIQVTTGAQWGYSAHGDRAPGYNAANHYEVTWL